MGGGLMQLVAYGAQDVYLTGNPQITFFKVVYRRHTNFSVEPIQQVFNGSPDFGRTVTCNLNRNGDLITNMYSVITLDAATTVLSAETEKTSPKWGYVRRLGYAVIQSTKIEIGGSKIDEQYGDWLNIWQELSQKVGQNRGHAKMIGDVSELTQFARSHGEYTMYVPLAFWFNRHNGLALPLIALQYHDVRVTIQYRNSSECLNWARPALVGVPSSVRMKESYLLIDYVYLDSEERKRFAQASHEYLIEQLQFTGAESLQNTNNKFRLNFNHPSKFLIWAPHLQKYAKGDAFLAYADDGNWTAASERAAKIVWLASRNLAEPVTDSSGEYIVNSDASGDNYGFGGAGGSDVDSVAPIREGINATLAALASKVDAQLMFSQGTIYTADPENVLILRNDLTSEDLSTSLGDISDSVNGNWLKQTEASNPHGVFVQDHFNYGRYLNCSGNPVLSAKLQLNGHDRFQERDGSYFNYVQPWQHFSNTPADGINVYSFALKPEDHQPSGTCNFSRIDNATLNVTVVDKEELDADSNINIYTVNYNVLRVMSGMAGTAYSN